MAAQIERVLVVEDDPADARLLRENIRDAFDGKVSMDWARSLAEALDVLGRTRPSVVLLDLRLPDAVGIESVRRIRNEHPDLPVVVVTHLDEFDAALACLDAGAQDYVTKAEIHPRALARVVAHAAERQMLISSAERAREVERQAERHARELAAIVQHAGDAVVTWTLDGMVATWNPAAERLWGKPGAEVIGQPVEAFVPEELRREFRDRVAKVLAGEDVPLLRTYRVRPDGTLVEIEERLFAIPDESGRPVRVGCIARDATELERLRGLVGHVAAASADFAARGVVGDPAMGRVMEAARLAARDPGTTVLILGETGVGKGWLARWIHAHSPRAAHAFFELNCAGLAPQLVESDLFGHERGAFTGAYEQKRGLVEVADGGTIFLDEIGELPPAVQAQLLTFLDTRTYRRVGGHRALTSDVRILAATNADLERLVAEGRFRQDLYYRINVFPIRLPPLRERREAIPVLAERILREISARTARPMARLAEGVMERLMAWRWPGNIRELRNVLERCAILAQDGTIRLEHLPAEIRLGAAEDVRDGAAAGAGGGLRRLEEEHILKVLESVGGNRSRAAQILGISRATLKRRLARMGLRVPRAGTPHGA